MKSYILQVSEFHKRLDIPIGVPLVDTYDSVYEEFLRIAAQTLHDMSIALEHVANSHPEDVRLVRAHLFVEEISEAIQALIEQDETALLDALADITFITLGTAVTYDLPIEEGLQEVCRSNLTKRRLPDDVRCRDKGPNYEPPRLEEVLAAYRRKQK